jgi:hypothetical protein
VTGPAFAAEVINATPQDRDPLTAVMDADRLWQASQRAAAQAAEQAALTEPRERRPGAEGTMTSVGEILDETGPRWLQPDPVEAKR